MDSHVDSTPGLGLPQPSPEQGAAALGGYPEAYRTEAAPVVAENAPMLQPAAPPLPPPMAQATTAPVQSQASVSVQQQTATSAAASADDASDALDEEWINKAKAIVEQTKTDPFVESKELSKAKADYLRIRYNKQIKVVEERQQ